MKLGKFLRESYVEMTKQTTWIPYAEVQKSTFLVVFISFFLAGSIFVMDKFFQEFMDVVFNLF